MAKIIEEMKAVFANSFMQPQCYRGLDIQDEIMEAGLDLEDDGIYCRLSADGYLDCTDWSGPYKSVDDAARALIEMYGE